MLRGIFITGGGFLLIPVALYMIYDSIKHELRKNG